MSLWGLRRLQACVICCATRLITNSVSVDGHSPADCTNIGCYLTIQVPHHSANTQCTVSGATFMQNSIYLSFSLPSRPLQPPFVQPILIPLFFLLTLPPTNVSCLRISYLRPLYCHPPFQFLTNPTYSTHILSIHSSLLSFVR